MSSTFLVIGAAGGIGSVLCRRLSAAGDRLALASRDSQRLQSLGEELGAPTFSLDATSIDEVDEVVQKVVEQCGPLDGVVNLVGSILLRPAHRTSAEEWHSVLADNLTTAFAAIRSGAKAMQRTGGSLVVVSSAAARVGLPNHEALAAAKAGVEGLARSAAATYAKRGIRVNVVSPGLIRTPLSEHLLKSPASEQASTAMHPLGRLGQPEEVASAIAWLLDPMQSWVTGQVLGVDGGLATLKGG